MNILLYFPGIVLVLIKQLGLLQTLLHLFNMLLMHLIIAYPFLFAHPRTYLAGAFNLSRQFLFKWTVNWRFVPEDIFLSKSFAYALLLCHLTLLAAFALRKWTTSDGGPIKVLLRAIFKPFIPAAFVLPSGDGAAHNLRVYLSGVLQPDHFAEIITILFTCNLIGVLCARSLHYQFYSWYVQQVPFLAWRTRYPLPIK
jgi:alpha-1,3-mannosyltransferase